MPKPTRKWDRTVLKLPKNHGWRAKPGYKIFVANQGEVRFDIPRDWAVNPGDDSIRITDRQPPDDDCLLQVSVMHLPLGVDWSQLPLRRLVHDVLQHDEDGTRREGEIYEVERPDLELAWTEALVVDPVEKRPACSRACLARAGMVQPLITMDFWPEHRDRFVPVWDEVLRSLQLDQHFPDPTGYILH